MKLLVRIWLLACLCFAVYQSLQPEPPIAHAQANDCPGCCFTYQSAFGDCEGEDPCDDAQYEITAASPTGAGLKSFETRQNPATYQVVEAFRMFLPPLIIPPAAIKTVMATTGQAVAAEQTVMIKTVPLTQARLRCVMTA